MIKNVVPITSADFNKGLVTRSDFLKGDINASPNTMDVQWNFDASLHKRLGASSTNAIALGVTSTNGWTLDTNSSLSTNLQAYWKLDEPSGDRFSQVGSNTLTDSNNTLSIVGIRNQAANFVVANTNLLYISSANILNTSSSNFSVSGWVYQNTFRDGQFIQQGWDTNTNVNFSVLLVNNRDVLFRVTSNGTVASSVSVTASASWNTGSWFNIIAWHSNNSHIGLSVNNVVTTAAYTGTNFMSSAGFLSIGNEITTGLNYPNITNTLDGRIDEVGLWNKVLTAQERSDLYGGGTGNTYSGTAYSSFGWASFDFGASAIRWLTIAAGTGLYASSNRGTTFVVIGTTRTQSYQSLTRSRNVLIATSDQYDVPLYWAGSAGTFAAALAPGSAPAVKFAVNFNGFLILLNSALRKRGFFYEDENLQLTQPWTTSFDLPSSDDDEITAPFILNKYLYVSTRYRIFRTAFQGGNPDWVFAQVKDWGYVPRTVALVSIEGGGQVAVGLDWNRRLRMFDGVDDKFMSDNVENDNQICDFAMKKVSYAGSGLQICHAILDPNTQEYRLNVAIGAQSTQTTHALLFNARNLAMYPYQNQGWQTMCVAESNNQQALMACDRSGFVYILNSGNLDGTVPINENYDSPPLFSKLPEVVSKGHQLNLFFSVKSSGVIYHQDRPDLSNQWSPMVPLSNADGDTVITGTENVIKVLRTVNTPSVYNTYQFRLTSSAGTAVPWELDRLDYLQQGFGIGRGA